MIYVDYGFPFPKLLPDPHHLSTHTTSCILQNIKQTNKQKHKNQNKTKNS